MHLDTHTHTQTSTHTLTHTPYTSRCEYTTLRVSPSFSTDECLLAFPGIVVQVFRCVCLIRLCACLRFAMSCTCTYILTYISTHIRMWYIYICTCLYVCIYKCTSNMCLSACLCARVRVCATSLIPEPGPLSPTFSIRTWFGWGAIRRVLHCSPIWIRDGQAFVSVCHLPSFSKLAHNICHERNAPSLHPERGGEARDWTPILGR